MDLQIPEIFKLLMTADPLEHPYISLPGGRNCVSGDTEFFTGSGWKRIDSYQEGDKVGVVSKDKTLSLEHSQWLKQPSKGFYHICPPQGLDMMLSPSHTVPYNNKGKYLQDNYKTLTMQEVFNRHSKSKSGWEGCIPTSVKKSVIGKGLDISEGELRLQVAVMADGRIVKEGKDNYCQMRFSKKHKYDRLLELCNKFDLKFKDNGGKFYEKYSNNTEYEVIVWPKWVDKSFNEKYWSCSQEQLELIIDEIRYWDGSISKKCTTTVDYTSTRQGDVEFVQYAALCCRYNTSITFKPSKGNNKQLNRVIISDRKSGTRSFANKDSKLEIPFVESEDGYQYCFTTTTGFWLARRNGRVFVTGNSGKSYAAGIYAILRSLESPINILFTREFQNSIKDSSYQVLVDTIERLKVSHLFKINKTEILGMNGSKISFKGLKTNISSIKSFEDVSLCVCEEAENISESSWAALIPTIRSHGSQILVIFNPSHKLGATYQRWVINPLPGTLVIHSTYLDNPFITEKAKAEIEFLKQEDYDKYCNVYLGHPLGDSDNAVIKTKWFKAALDAHKKLGFSGEGIEAIGYDPSDEGRDPAAFVHRHGSIVKSIKELNNAMLENYTTDVYNYAKENGISNIVYDSIGLGVGCRVKLDALDPQDKLTKVPFDARASASNELYKGDHKAKGYFKNLRSEHIFRLADRFRNTYLAVSKGKYISPDEMISISSEIPKELLDKLEYECTNVREKLNTSFKQIESKEEMRERLLKSPNLFDALYYSFYPIKTDEEYKEIEFTPIW